MMQHKKTANDYHLVVTWKNFLEEEKANVLGLDKDLQALAEDIAQEAFNEKIVPLLNRYAGGHQAHLHVHIDRYSLEDAYSVRTRLQLPGKVLFSQNDDAELEVAILGAMDDLAWSLEQYLERLQRKADSKRRTRENRQKLDKLHRAASESSTQQKQDFFSAVNALLPEVRKFIEHEVNYMRSQGDLPWDFPEVQDVLDEVLVRAFESGNRPADSNSLKEWLIQLSIDVLAEESAKFKAESQMTPKEKWYDPLDEITDEEFWEFYQPDDGRHVEDMESDYETDPEKYVENVSMAHYFQEVLKQLPARWRRALELVYQNQVSPEQAAQCLKVSQDELQDMLQKAIGFLREKLTEAGFNPAEDGMVAEYLTPEDFTDEYKQEVEAELRQALGL